MRFFIFMLLANSLVAQQAENISLVYNYDDPDLPDRSSGQQYNDCWGYVGPDGEEVAIIGTLDSVLFFDISDINDVIKLPGVEFGARSSWRDFKTYENYCYAVADQGTEGLGIINMDSLQAGVVSARQETAHFSQCHNVWIDTATAKLYIVGSDTEYDGLIIYDLSVDPYHPTLWAQYDLRDYGVNCGNTGYLHDIHVRNDTAYCNVIYNNCGYYVLDVSNTTPSIIGSLPGSTFGGGLNHSNWVSDDGSFAVVAEETHGLPLSFVDLENLADMSILSTFQAPLFEPDSNANIAHNPFINGDLCFVAYYHDGLQILDISDPADPVRVGYFDSDPDPTTYNGYLGAWGTYPYFPSDHVIVSDVKYGLHVLEVDQSLMAADWKDFQVSYWDTEKFSLHTEFQTTYAIERVTVQWSADGRSFLDWADIDPDVFSHLTYRWSGYLDRPQRGAFFVRLKTLETDGEFSFSPIRRVTATASLTNSVFPQPAAQHLQVESTAAGFWELRNLKGQLVFETPVDSEIQSIQLPQQILSGVYIGIWRARSGTIIDRQKIIIQQ